MGRTAAVVGARRIAKRNMVGVWFRMGWQRVAVGKKICCESMSVYHSMNTNEQYEKFF